MIFLFRQQLDHPKCPSFLEAEWENGILNVALDSVLNDWPPFVAGYPNDSGISLLVKRSISDELREEGIDLPLGEARVVESLPSGECKPGGAILAATEYFYLKRTIGIEVLKDPETLDFMGVVPDSWSGNELVYSPTGGNLLFCSEAIVKLARKGRWPFCRFTVARTDSSANPLFVTPFNATERQWPPEGLADILS